MKVKDIIKKQTTIIAIAVVLVVVAAISVSYAIFFDVKTSETHVVVAGKLKVTVENSEALALDTPIPNSDGLKTEGLTYTVKNTDSNLPTKYDVYIYSGATGDTALPLQNIYFSTNGTTAQALTSITPTNVDGKSCFRIDGGTLAAAGTGTAKNLKIWVNEDSISDEMEGKKVDLFLYIVSEVQE